MSFSRAGRGNTKPLPGAQLDFSHRLSQGLIGCWIFNEQNGTRVGDSTSFMLDGVATNGPVWGGSIHGGGLTFDGTNDYIELGDTPLVDFAGNNFTIATWFRTAVPSGSTRQMLVAKDNSGGSARQFGLVYNSNADTTNALQLFFFKSGDVVCQCTSASNLIIDSKWHHLAGLRRGSILELWLDGVLIQVGPTEATTIGNMQATAAKLRFGNREFTGATNHLNGGLDDVRIYNRALSPDGIQSLYSDPYSNFLRVPRRRLFVAAAFTGTIAVTQSSHTTAISGKERFKGPIAVTQSAHTTAISGKEIFKGTVAVTQSAHTTSIAVKERFKGPIAVTQSAHTTAISGKERFVSAIAVTQSAHTTSISGKELFKGTVAVTQSSHTTAASGKEIFRSTIAVTQSSHSSATSGGERFSGTAALTQSAQILDADGLVIAAGSFAGIIDVTQSPHTMTATGIETEPLVVIPPGGDLARWWNIRPRRQPRRERPKPPQFPITGEIHVTQSRHEMRAFGIVTPPKKKISPIARVQRRRIREGAIPIEYIKPPMIFGSFQAEHSRHKSSIQVVMTTKRLDEELEELACMFLLED